MPPILQTLAAILILPPLALHAVALVLPRKPATMLTFAARSLVSITCLLVAACYGVVVSAALRTVGYGGLSQWTTARCFKWLMWWGTGVGFVVVEGEEWLGERPAVFLGNHQT